MTSGESKIRPLDSLLHGLEARKAGLWLRSLVLELGGREATLGLGFCTDETIAETNERYRQKSGPTDVLSFPSLAADSADPADPLTEAGRDLSPVAAQESQHYLGDVLISVDTAQRQAVMAGRSFAWELQCLIIHGLLHCLGHDHERDDGAMDHAELGLRERWVNDELDWSLPHDAECPTGAIQEPEVGEPIDDDGGGVTHFGRVALVGRPNAGKSTLMNQWLGEKLAIVSDKPQTTRHRLVGILSEKRGQIAFLDTPGIHKPQHRLNRRMVKAASDALSEADVICLLVDASVKWGKGDQFVQELIAKKSQPKMVLLNKIDLIKKSRLLPLIERYAEAGFEPVVPISALEGDGTKEVLDLVWDLLPAGQPEFDKQLLTLQTERFLTAERIREKILERTRDELPFVVAVTIDQWEERDGGVLFLAASIVVERDGQKSILIGKGGQQIKAVGSAAREDLEQFLGCRVYLDLVVRTEKGWREDPRAIAELENYQMA